jgi:3-oxoadipate enol-lactonase
VPRVRVNGTPLHYERHGAGEPLLLVTGFTISAAVFEPVLDLYGERFECILYDNRGSGRSGAPLKPTSMAELAADAAGLLGELDVDSAHVCGLSMGGMIAQELAIRFPERVRGLVLGGTTPGGPRAARPKLSQLSALGAGAAGGWSDREREWLGEWLFSDEFRREQPERVRELLRNFGRHRAPPQGVWSHWWASVYHDTLSRLKCIEAPTLVMHGERDAMAPISNARLLAERIPDAELAIVPGAGHAYLLERPEASFELLTGWLDPRSPIAPGRARTGVAARAEPLTRALGLPIGAARTGVSLAGAMTDRLRK